MKKILSVVLAAFMIVSCLPQISFADSENITYTAEIMKAKGGADSIISMTYDDGIYDTALFLNEQFEMYNLRGSCAMIPAKNITSDADLLKWREVFAKGYLDAQSHSMTHMVLPGQVWIDANGETGQKAALNNTPENYQKELVDSKDLLNEYFDNDVLCLIASNNTLSNGAWEVAAKTYYATRLGSFGDQSLDVAIDNDPSDGAEKGTWQNLYMRSLYRSQSPEALRSLIDNAIEKNLWLVTLCHAVKPLENGGDMTVENAKAFYKYIGQKQGEGRIWSATFGEAAKYLRERQNSTVSEYERNSKIYVKIDMADKTEDNLPLDGAVFNYPLTVKAQVPSDYEAVCYSLNGIEQYAKTFVENEKTYAYVDVVPNGGEVLVKKADLSLASAYSSISGYVENADNEKNVMESSEGLSVNGRAVVYSEGAQKTYIKLSLENYNNENASFSFKTNDGDKGNLLVYGLCDKDECENWSSETINYLNAPGNDRYGYGIDTSKAYLNAPLESMEVSGEQTYSIDISDYASYMKENGANYITLVFVNSSVNKKSVFEENFEQTTLKTTVSRSGDPLITEKCSDFDHTTGSGSSYHMQADSSWDRIKFDASGEYAKLTTEDKNRKYRVSFYALMDKAGTFELGPTASRGGAIEQQLVKCSIDEANTWKKFTYEFTATENEGWADEVISGKPATYVQTGLNLFVTFQNVRTASSVANANNILNLYIDDITVEQVGLGSVCINPVDFSDGKTLISKINFNTNVNGDKKLSLNYEDVNTTAGSFAWAGCEAATVAQCSNEENYSGSNGLSFLFSPNKKYNRIKFYNIFDHVLTNADKDRKFEISFMLKSDTAGSFRYGMMSKMPRVAEDKGSSLTYKVEDGTADEKSYSANIYQPKLGTVSSAEKGMWKKFTYEITIDDTMLPKNVNVYNNSTGTKTGTYPTGIALLGIESANFENFSDGAYNPQPKIYIDDIIVKEIKDTEESAKTYTYSTSFEDLNSAPGSTYFGVGLDTGCVDGADKAFIDKFAIDTSTSRTGAKSLKIYSTATHNRFKIGNITDSLTASDIGKKYKVRFYMKSNKSGSFKMGMMSTKYKPGSTTDESTYNTALDQAKLYSVSAEQINSWVLYTYEFDITTAQTDDGAVYLAIYPTSMGQSKTPYKTEDNVKYYNSSDIDPLIFNIDDFSSRELSEASGTTIEISDAASVSTQKKDTESYMAVGIDENSAAKYIRKAYYKFDAAEYDGLVRAVLKLNVSDAAGQSVCVYALKDAEYPEQLTYENAPANTADEGIDLALCYLANPMAKIENVLAGEYSIDVTDYIKSHNGKDVVFAVCSSDVLGKEYIKLDFEKATSAKDLGIVNFGGYGKNVLIENGELVVDGIENSGEGIAVYDVFGAGKTVSAGETYKVSADITALGEDGALLSMGLANKTSSELWGANFADITLEAGEKKTVSFTVRASKTDEENGVCAVAIRSENLSGFKVDNLSVVSENPIKLSKSAEIEIETAKEAEQIQKTAGITLSTTGDNVILDGKDMGAESTQEIAVGKTVSISASGSGRFLYWKDRDSGLIVSYDKDYEFTVGSSRNLAAIFAGESEVYVTFKNINQMVIAEGNAENIKVPNDPYVYGYEFKGWYKDGKISEYKAGEQVTDEQSAQYIAGFGKKETAYKITINGEEKTYSYNDKVTVSAEAEKDGKTFSYWAKDGVAASYDKEYSFYASADSVLEAVYGESAESKNVLVMANPVMADETRIAFFAERNISSDYEIIETGILMGKAENLSVESASIKAVAKSKDQKGQFTVRKANVSAGDTWYGRAYVIYSDENGEVYTIYSNEVSMTVK